MAESSQGLSAAALNSIGKAILTQATGGLRGAILTRHLENDIQRDLGGIEALGFPISPNMAAKRPFEDVGAGNHIQSPEAKRVKTENETEEESFEDGLALLVQNTLSNVNGLIDGLGQDDEPAVATSPDTVSGSKEKEEVPMPASFILEPAKYLQSASIHSLGNLVCWG